jgi:hypothetical protein
MIDCTLDREHRILYVHPEGALDVSDFSALAATADSFIAKAGNLAGLIIDARHFPAGQQAAARDWVTSGS